MKIHNAEFLNSFYTLDHCPNDKPEFAFIGRSNVGKSSLVNFLTERKNLAKTSAKPGKTESINYFMINYQWYLVDLPGYGFAATSKQQRMEFERLIRNYIYRSPLLYNVFVLVDSSIPPQNSDISFINDLGMNEIPLSVIFTKTDKISQNQLLQNIDQFNNRLLENWEELPKYFYASTIKNIGKTEILKYISDILNTLK